LARPALLSTLHGLGQTLRLILEDLWRNEVVALGDQAAVSRYLQAVDGEPADEG
jgi:hypothetical protein